MGLIICDKHGESGFMPFVSKELSNRILGGEEFRKSELAQIDVALIDEDDGEEIYTMQYLMTKKCLDQAGAQTKYELRSDEDERVFHSIFDPVMKGGGICGKCFKEAIVN